MIVPIIIALAFLAFAIGVGIYYRMLGKMILMLIILAVVLGGIFGYKMYSFKTMMAQMSSMDMRQTVSSVKAENSDWQPDLETVGSLRAAKGVDISNELAGIVGDIHFTSGGDVKAGALLVDMRAQDDIAKLQSLEAAAKLSQITYNRDRKQLAVQAISQAAVDADSANLASARALAAQQRALVEKKFIRAPFAGHLGIRNVDMGQYLNPGTSIVTLQQLDPIYLDFNLPQQAISQVKVGQKLTVKNDTWPGRNFAGKVTAISPKVDLSTRNVAVRAELSNTDHALLPGMYATADIAIGEPHQSVTLPQTAITYNPYGDTVFVITANGKNDKGEDKLTVEQRFVTVGSTRGDQVEILKGVKAGETVVSSGQLKLQNGSGVVINNDTQPKNDPNPQPQEQ